MPTTPDNIDPQANEPVFPIREYLGILYQRKLGFLLAATLIVCLGIAYTMHQPLIYEASTTVIIDPEPPTISPVDTMDAGQQWYMRDTYYDTQLRIMQSRNVAQRVVKDLGLAQDIDFLGLSEIQDPKQLESAIKKRDPVSILLGRLRVDAVTGTRLVKIAVRDKDPERAATLSNAIARAYSEQNAEFRLTALNKTSEFMVQQNADNEKKLDAARNALNDFQETHKILYSNPLEQQKITNSRLTALFNKRIEVETQREHVGYTIAELQPYSLEIENALTYASITGSSVNELGLNACRELKREEQTLLLTYHEKAPQVVNIHEQVVQCEAFILNAMKSMKDALHARHQSLTKLNTEINSEIIKLQKEALALDQLRLLYEEFETQKAEQERLYGESQRKLNEVSLNRLLEINNIRILDLAIESRNPVSPNILINAVITLMAAFCFGIFTVLLLELLDITVRTQADIETRARMPFLGSIPKFKSSHLLAGGNSYRFIIENPHSPISECIRTLRTTLTFLLPENETQVLLVTSAQPYDGKTMTSLNLAVTTAAAGKRVVLLEADLRKPRLYKALNIRQDIGLSSLIQGESVLENSICHTEIQGLDLIPCGKLPQSPAELFQHDNFKKILDQLRKKYDFIIIDSPPVTVVSDALIISQHVNGVAVIARANKTPLPYLIRTRELLEGVNAPIMGVILNDMKSNAHGYGAYYYYKHEYKS